VGCPTEDWNWFTIKPPNHRAMTLGFPKPRVELAAHQQIQEMCELFYTRALGSEFFGQKTIGCELGGVPMRQFVATVDFEGERLCGLALVSVDEVPDLVTENPEKRHASICVPGMFFDVGIRFRRVSKPVPLQKAVEIVRINNDRAKFRVEPDIILIPLPGLGPCLERYTIDAKEDEVEVVRSWRAVYVPGILEGRVCEKQLEVLATRLLEFVGDHSVLDDVLDELRVGGGEETGQRKSHHHQ
jgi:hypothetical protein